jgi:hypothetical protein
MQSDKPAPKRQYFVTKAPENLVFQRSFELFVSLPMQECVVRLKYATHEEVYLKRIAPNKVRFDFVQRGSKFGHMWAVGCIEELDESRTRIFGITGVPYQDIIMNIVVSASMLILFMFSMFSNFSSLASISSAFIVVILFVPAFITFASSLGTWQIDGKAPNHRGSGKFWII